MNSIEFPMIRKPKVILVVAAHPDDEVLGCGATIARHAENGESVHILFLADGVGARGKIKNGDIDARIRAALQAAHVLGAHKPNFIHFPDNRMDSVDFLDVVKEIEKVVRDLNPDIVYTHHEGDLNIDHRIVHQAVMTACRPEPNKTVTEIYSFEVASSTGWASHDQSKVFIPNVFYDVSSEWGKKVAALRCYDDEINEFPHARSYVGIESFARYRGVNVGVVYAEAFHLERMIK